MTVDRLILTDELEPEWVVIAELGKGEDFTEIRADANAPVHHLVDYMAWYHSRGPLPAGDRFLRAVLHEEDYPKVRGFAMGVEAWERLAELAMDVQNMPAPETDDDKSDDDADG